MALLLSDIITAARDRHPAFEKRRVPDAVLARYLTGYQRELLSKAITRNRSYLAQVCSILFDISDANAVGTAGVNTAGGHPATVSAGGVTSQVESPVGSAMELNTDDAVLRYGEKPVTSATATTWTYTPAAWVVNEHTNRVVAIVAGKGAGQRRYIASNTANVGTVTAAWDEIPDATSTFKIVEALTEVTEELGVVAAYPFTQDRVGYLIRLDGNGLPFLDLTKPLVASFDAAINLPPHHALIGGQVRFTTGTQTAPLAIQDYKARFHARSPYSAYELNGQLFLVGSDADWNGVQSIELRYVPVPPALTALTDLFLLPDTAYTPLVSGAALMAGLRVNGLPDVPKIDLSGLGAQKADSETQWLHEVLVAKRNRSSFMKEY